MNPIHVLCNLALRASPSWPNLGLLDVSGLLTPPMSAIEQSDPLPLQDLPDTPPNSAAASLAPHMYRRRVPAQLAAELQAPQMQALQLALPAVVQAQDVAGQPPRLPVNTWEALQLEVRRAPQAVHAFNRLPSHASNDLHAISQNAHLGADNVLRTEAGDSFFLSAPIFQSVLNDIFLVRHVSPRVDLVFAAKRSPADYVGAARAAARSLPHDAAAREIGMLRRVRSPMAPLAVLHTSEHRYMLSPWMRGDLFDAIESNLDRQMRVLLAAQLLLCGGQALQALHAQGLGHGDLKDENFLFDGYGTLCLADFETVQANLPGAKWLGTPGYMPPEVLRAPKQYRVDLGDLWSLGATAATILTGDSTPFSLMQDDGKGGVFYDIHAFDKFEQARLRSRALLRGKVKDATAYRNNGAFDDWFFHLFYTHAKVAQVIRMLMHPHAAKRLKAAELPQTLATFGLVLDEQRLQGLRFRLQQVATASTAACIPEVTAAQRAEALRA